MPILITPGAFTRASSFTRLADRFGARIDRPRGCIAQLDLRGLDAIQSSLIAGIDAAPDDGTPSS